MGLGFLVERMLPLSKVHFRMGLVTHAILIEVGFAGESCVSIVSAENIEAEPWNSPIKRVGDIAPRQFMPLAVLIDADAVSGPPTPTVGTSPDDHCTLPVAHVSSVGLEVDGVQYSPRLIVLTLGDLEVGRDVAERLACDAFVRSSRAVPLRLDGTTIR